MISMGILRYSFCAKGISAMLRPCLMASLNRRRYGRDTRLRGRFHSRSRTAGGALLALLLPLFDFLQLLVDPHGDVLHDEIGHAETAFDFLHRLGTRAELEQDVITLAAFLDPV